MIESHPWITRGIISKSCKYHFKEQQSFSLRIIVSMILHVDKNTTPWLTKTLLKSNRWILMLQLEARAPKMTGYHQEASNRCPVITKPSNYTPFNLILSLLLHSPFIPGHSILNNGSALFLSPPLPLPLNRSPAFNNNIQSLPILLLYKRGLSLASSSSSFSWPLPPLLIHMQNFYIQH